MVARPIFDHREAVPVLRETTPRVSASHGATAQAASLPVLPWVSGQTEARAHVGVVGRLLRACDGSSGENRAGRCRELDACACAFVRDTVQV
jgi:hypothetical protein